MLIDWGVPKRILIVGIFVISAEGQRMGVDEAFLELQWLDSTF